MIDVSKLEGAALDAAVFAIEFPGAHQVRAPYYSSLRDLGGPIIERERIATACDLRGVWEAFVGGGNFGPDGQLEAEFYHPEAEGPTLLIAAMRAFGASRATAEKENFPGLNEATVGPVNVDQLTATLGGKGKAL